MAPAVSPMESSNVARAMQAKFSEMDAANASFYAQRTADFEKRLTEAQHRHHDLQVATMHVHLDHDSCLEVAVLRGPAAELRALADETTSQRGVRHGQLHLVPAEVRHARHVHGRHVHGRHVHGNSGRTHTHIKA